MVLVGALASVLDGGETSEAARGSPRVVFVPPVFDPEKAFYRTVCGPFTIQRDHIDAKRPHF